ncbi:SDR family oxidoreductase [candidate division KSB1 bacterium]|nr:SDR family oxidoreductase [candidate division KSB1 bacterium]
MYLTELFGLKGKTALVIGGGGVLAGKIAEGLAKAGANIAIFDKNEENAHKQSEKIKSEGGQAIAITGDASSKTDLENGQAKTLEAFKEINILLNAPGINSATPFFEITEEEWDLIIRVNLKSMFLACQIVGAQMLKQGKGGSIINFSSASSGPPLSKVFTYSVSKSGVNSLTQFLAREWAKEKIRVNALVPGFFPAEQNRKILSEERIKQIMNHTPMNRFGEAEELIAACIWLASEKASSFVTGSFVRVDGGFGAMTI